MKFESNIGDYLKENEIKPSFQRIKVFEYLVDKMNHPTVDMIYKELVNDIPTLSKTTIYNTLKLFVEHKIVSVVNIEDNETRYDADVSNHGHFKCSKCGKLYDFNYENSNLSIKNLQNFKIEKTHLYLNGICVNCMD
ncbi:MAG: transcriptional repressor [Bacteroidales bacterium]|nr:transcriptional repressor [Bacteroidales bacterium]MBN2755579.1 transcriptional repressor [Bacteroidales bacterium]